MGSRRPPCRMPAGRKASSSKGACHKAALRPPRSWRLWGPVTRLKKEAAELRSSQGREAPASIPAAPARRQCLHRVQKSPEDWPRLETASSGQGEGGLPAHAFQSDSPRRTELSRRARKCGRPAAEGGRGAGDWRAWPCCMATSTAAMHFTRFRSMSIALPPSAPRAAARRPVSDLHPGRSCSASAQRGQGRSVPGSAPQVPGRASSSDTGRSAPRCARVTR